MCHGRTTPFLLFTEISLSSAIAGTILRVTYGIEVATSNDKFVALAEAALLCMSQALRPGAFLVDVLPFRKFIFSFLI